MYVYVCVCVDDLFIVALRLSAWQVFFSIPDPFQLTVTCQIQSRVHECH